MRPLLVAAVLGAWLSSGGSPEKNVAEKISPATRKVENRGVELLCTIPGDAKAGSAIGLKLEVTNRRKNEIQFFVSRFEDYRFIVSDGGGKQVPLTRFGEAFKRSEDGRRVPIIVPPGETRETIVNLGLIFDLSMPGEYRLSVSLRYREGFEPDTALEIKAIPFTVLRTPPFRRI